MPWSLALLSLVPLLAPPLHAQLGLPDLIARMEAAVGLAGGPSAGDCVLTGEMTSQGQRFVQTITIRREPFAYREELRWIPGAPGAAPPEGVPRHAVFLSDGELSWNLADELGPEGVLTGWTAVAVLDNALLFRLLLDPRAALEQSTRGAPRVVTGEAMPLDPEAETVHVTWRHGTSWLANVDRSSARLGGLYDSSKVTRRWYALSDWQALEGGAIFPTLLKAGENDRTASEVRYRSLLIAQIPPPSTFPGPPVPALGAVEDVARLELMQEALPGALLVIVPEGEVWGGQGSVRDVWTLLDTGANGACADPRLAGTMDLPLLGRQLNTGLLGGGESDRRWLDRVSLGRHRMLQISAATPTLPPQPPLPREHPVGLVLGGPRLMALSPVLDLRARRLLLRGRDADGRVRPLSEIAGRVTFTLPLVADSRDSLRLEYSLGGVSATAMLDTGFPYVARLSRADMRHLGLPVDDREWQRRGALGINISGVHGHVGQELAVRLDQDLQLGPVTLRRPVVILQGEKLEGAELAADTTLIGMGAFSAFEQVGFDRGEVLELVAPDELVRPGETPGVVVPPSEDQLGFDLQAADRGATGRPHNLPHVLRVLPGFPGERAGLRDGDYLAEIDGVACDGVPPMHVWPRLRLEGRTEVRLSVLREAERLDVVIHALPPTEDAR